MPSNQHARIQDSRDLQFNIAFSSSRDEGKAEESMIDSHGIIEVFVVLKIICHYYNKINCFGKSTNFYICL